jgi:UDP:flavonoid glycosyltransferase YjiC (YdhE family)
VRALFTFVGGVGHLEPLLPVARAVAAAGHTVAIAGSGNQMPRVEATGFTALPTSPQRPPAASGRDLTPLRPTDPHDAEREFAENFADRGARRHIVAVGEYIRAWRPDVVVRDETDLGASMAAELAEVPCATVLILAAGTLARPELVSPPLQAIRREHGLRPDPDLATFGRDLVLSPFPPSFRDPSAPLPAHAAHYRPRPVAPEARGALVYVTLGTVMNTESGDLFERLVAGLAGVPAKILATVGRDVDPADLGSQPPHVQVEQYVVQSQVLPRCALVVSHGGSGSLMGALEHGLPSVLTPLGADQPHNAARAEALGVATILDAASCTPEQVELAVREMLTNGHGRQAAFALKAEIDALPPVESTVARLEGLAGHEGVLPSSWPPRVTS